MFNNILLSIYLTCISGISLGYCNSHNDKDDIPMDMAKIFVTSNVTINITTQSEECYKCPMVSVVTEGNGNHTFLVDTRWKTRLEISTTVPSFGCSEQILSRHFEEHGIYNVDVKQIDSMIVCTVVLANSPTSTYLPLYIATACFVVAAVLWILVSKLRSKECCSKEDEYSPLIQQGHSTRTGSNVEHNGLLSSLNASTEIPLNDTFRINTGTESKSAHKKERLKSLDTFRGISIVIMIFVNYGGGGYWFFSHSKWNGLTVADLVFPWFVFIMGTSMAYSFTSLLRTNTPKYKVFWKIFRRTCTLFLLGLIINTNGCSSIDMKEIRIPGVLQRFAVTYLVVATTHMFFAKLPDDEIFQTHPLRDILNYWPEWIINACLISLHLILTFVLNVPGCQRGYLGPGGMAENGENFNCTGGAANYIDRQVFGEKHIFGSPTCTEIYHNPLPHEPEGLLGSLTSCVLCFLGLQAGKILKTYRETSQRVLRFCVWGAVLGTIAGILCKFSKNDGWIPVNKNLWSVSFIFCMASFAFFLLCFCYLMIDVWKIWNGAPFYYPGMNAILVYMGHELFHKNFPVSWQVPDTHASQLPLDLYGTSFWVVVATYLYYIGSFYVI